MSDIFAPDPIPKPKIPDPTGQRIGRPPNDYDAMALIMLDDIAAGLSVAAAAKRRGWDSNDPMLWRTLSSDAWREQYQTARRSGALARVDRAQERLENLADDAANGVPVKREAIDAARWATTHAQWMAERSDPDSWGREDRLKTTQVSAVRIILEAPPNLVQLPPAEYVQELPPVQRETPRLGDGGQREGTGEG